MQYLPCIRLTSTSRQLYNFERPFCIAWWLQHSAWLGLALSD